MQQLEARLGARLLQRTTRQVTPTPEGDLFHRRCLAILADIDEAEAVVSEAVPRGPLRIDMTGKLARHYLVPGLPEFLARYPGIRLHIGEGERIVDLVHEGVDLVVRVGEPADSGLKVRRLAMLPECTLASPEYLATHGVPATLDDLGGHCMIGFVSSATGAVMPLEFQTEAGLREVMLPASITVSSATMNFALAQRGLGLIQVPRYRSEEDITAGRLVEVLPAHPPTPSPVSILYPGSRQLSSRARVFIDWVAARFSGEIAPRQP